MLHELLLVLSGHASDVFVDADERDARAARGGGGGGGAAARALLSGAPDGRLVLAEGSAAAGAGAAEARALRPLLRLAHCYRALRAFLGSHAGGVGAGGSPAAPAAAALARGIDEVLGGYRGTLLALERTALSEEGILLSGMTAALTEAEEVLPRLYALCGAAAEAMADADASGMGSTSAAISRALRGEAFCGLPSAQRAALRCEWHVNQLMLKHVGAWVVHGLLTDERADFFIVRSDTRRASQQARQRDESGEQQEQQQQRQDSADDLDGTVPDASGANLLRVWDAYVVDLSALPPAVSAAAAEDLLFAGNAARLLLSPPSATRKLLKGPMDELLPAADRRAFATALARLGEAPELRRDMLTAVAAALKRRAAARLWQLMQGRAGLEAHLGALKSFFLMARGDFYHTFLEGAAGLMALPPRRSTAETDLQAHFSAALQRSSALDDALASRVTVRVSTGSEAGADAALVGETARVGLSAQGSLASSSASGALRLPSLDGWDGVCLEYEPDWPLQLLLTPAAMGVYNSVFRYLFRLRRLQMALDSAWRAAADSPAWHLRHHMAYLINNLQYYLQIDVIDAQHAELMAAVATATDFTELQRAHERFLGALVSQSFLDVVAIGAQIEKLLALCSALCGVVDRAATQNVMCDTSAVETLTEQFDRSSSQLFMILHGSKLSGSSRAPSLRQLLLRLNFNGFVARTARQAARAAAAKSGLVPPPAAHPGGG